MKKIIFTLFVALFFLILTSPVFAVQEEATQGAGVGKRQAVGQEVKENLQEKIATAQARLIERKKEIIRKYFGRMIIRIEAAINRLNRLITRIESRIVKIETNNEGIKTDPIKKEVEKAKTLLIDTANQINVLKNKMETVIEGNTPKDGFQEIKSELSEIKENLKEVHQTLVKVIGDIKGLRVGNDEN